MYIMSDQKVKMSKSEAGRLGGLATYKKYGNGYMSMIGKRGAEKFHQKYRILPYRTSQYAIVCKETKTAINFF